MNDLIIVGNDLLDYYSEEELKQFFNIEVLDFDRIAIFIPITKGKYIIETDGFYKQTNPQPIASIEMDIE